MTHDTTGGPTADNLIERIKADCETGTKHAIADWSTDNYGNQKYTVKAAYADTARRNRVPELEARIFADAEALKAADELAEGNIDVVNEIRRKAKGNEN